MNQNDFLDCLIHNWDNRSQAQSQPSLYTYCHYDWCVEGDILKSKQWYHWDGEVYRERSNKLTVNDDKIILTILDNGIDVIFRKDEYGYIGKVDTYSNGIKVLSSITLNEETYTSFDQGIDSHGKIVWGDVEGPFIFHHTS
tara:strand:+ start:204 stop:626 length:423 start_codon:yes stop_codon:yes gene_type:complete